MNTRHFKLIVAASLAVLLTLICPTPDARADGRVYSWGGDGIYNGFPTHADTSWISNVVAIAAGSYQSIALKSNGTVIAWGANAETNFPPGLSNVVAVAAYDASCAALKANGRVLVWGTTYGTLAPTNIPPNLEDVAAISLGYGMCLALKSNGTVVAWGSRWTVTNVPPVLSNVVAISAGAYHALAARADGTVVAWPDSSLLSHFESTLEDYGQVNVPVGLSNVIAVAAGKFHSLALKSDGTVVAWGGGADLNAPPNLTNIVAIASGDDICLALRADGTVVEWLSTPTWADVGQRKVPADLSNVVAIASGASGYGTTHNLALYSAEPIIRRQPSSRSVIAGDNVVFSVSASSPTAMTFQWRFNGTNIAGATNATHSVTNAQAFDTGFYDVVVCSTYGCTTSRVATLAFKVADVQMLAAVTVQGLVGANTRVEWSADMIVWNTLTNFALPRSPFQFADWSSVGQPHRFYRVVFDP